MSEPLKLYCPNCEKHSNFDKTMIDFEYFKIIVKCPLCDYQMHFNAFTVTIKNPKPIKIGENDNDN